MSGESVLELDGVTKVYGEQPPVPALRGVSFSVRRGELVAIVGPSGSGKSTLLHVMGTLERPSSGVVRIGGVDAARLSDRELSLLRAREIGFVFQQFFLAEHATVRENVADGLLYAGVPAAERYRRADEALERVGLSERAAVRAQHRHRTRQLAQRGHRPRTGRGARLDRRGTTGHRPRLPRSADLAGTPVVQRRGHPEALAAAARHRQQRPDRLSGRPDVPRPCQHGPRRGEGRPPSTIYVRTATGHEAAVQSLLAQTANPEAPNEVNASQPSDALTARAAAAGAFDSLFLGLGVVALIVGAVGVANIMVISVLERRSEIGLRRALGATKGQIRTQFLAESILLAVIGGVVGVLAGAAATAVYASSKGWAVVIPAEAWSGGIASAILIGAFAGLMPALRASRMPATVALRTV